ncbi:MBL fold metallo-hydrolase [Phaeospirillum tilakii]|uniref:MBL fold metallo-hydrolase n=1 Tax=Phaeospirillum tilakii TaxID=741673 RepID=A0ABW5CBE6_9PROT
MAVRVRFWGVRGCVPSPAADHLGYGGNTSCFAVTIGSRLVIFDAGTGLRPLGAAIAAHGPAEADLFLSHYHWDHIAGLPFFAPGYDPSFRLRIHGPRLDGDCGPLAALARQMEPPNFPVTLGRMGGIAAIEEFEIGTTLTPAPGLRIVTAPLNHPGGACGYRLEAEGHVIAVVTDTEHRPGAPDPAVLALIAGADLMLYDATYDDDGFSDRVGWGHSTWQEAIRLARAAGVRRLVLVHHDPDRDDRALDAAAAAAAAQWDGAAFAREGTEIILD